MCIDFINGRCNRDFCLHAHSLDPEANTPEQVAQREAAYWYAQQQCRYEHTGDAPRLPSYYINRCREAANRRAERCTTHPSSLSQPPATGTPQGKSLSSGLHHLNTSCPTSPRIQLVPDSEIKQNQEDWMRCVRKPCTQMIHVAKVLMQGPVCSECLPVQEEEAASGVVRPGSRGEHASSPRPGRRGRLKRLQEEEAESAYSAQDEQVFKHSRNHKYVDSTSAALATRHGFTSTDNLMLHHTTTSTYNE